MPSTVPAFKKAASAAAENVVNGVVEDDDDEEGGGGGWVDGAASLEPAARSTLTCTPAATACAFARKLRSLLANIPDVSAVLAATVTITTCIPPAFVFCVLVPPGKSPANCFAAYTSAFPSSAAGADSRSRGRFENIFNGADAKSYIRNDIPRKQIGFIAQDIQQTYQTILTTLFL